MSFVPGYILATSFITGTFVVSKPHPLVLNVRYMEPDRNLLNDIVLFPFSFAGRLCKVVAFVNRSNSVYDGGVHPTGFGIQKMEYDSATKGVLGVLSFSASFRNVLLQTKKIIFSRFVCTQPLHFHFETVLSCQPRS